ncbi:MAG: dihydrodipicolinate synthase family protein [Thermoplasmata archaeon]
MNFKGIITPMITPVKKGKIDEPSIKTLVEFLVKSDAEGIFPGSSTGGFTLFSFEKHLKILKIARSSLPNNRIFLSGISRNDLEETVQMGRNAVDIGSDGVVVITPYYLKFDQDAIFRYYSEIASNIQIPVFIYNNPAFSSNEIMPETVEKLMNEHSNIVGLKDSAGDMRLFNRYIAHMPEHRYIFQGRDDLLYESLMLGASGGVCGISNFSEIIHKLYVSMDISLHKKVVLIAEKLQNLPNSVSYNYLFRKLVLGEKKPANYAMSPYADLNEKQLEEIEKVIKILKN